MRNAFSVLLAVLVGLPAPSGSALAASDVQAESATPAAATAKRELTPEDLAEKEAVLAAGGPAFFTIPHFDGYAAVLIQLDEVDETALREALVDAWLACAPVTLAREYLGDPTA